MLSKKQRAVLVFACLLFLLAGAVVLLIHGLIQKPSVQRYLMAQISRATDYDIRTGRIELSFWRGLGLTARNVKAKSWEGDGEIEASKVTLVLDGGQLWRGRLVPSHLVITKPKIQIPTPETGGGSPQQQADALRKMLARMLTKLRTVALREARFEMAGLPLSFHDLTFDLSKENGDPHALRIYVSGKTSFREREVPFTLAGKVVQDADGEAGPYFELDFKSDGIPVTWAGRPQGLNIIKGRMVVDAQVRGTPEGPIFAKGHMGIGEVQFSLTRNDREKIYIMPHLSLDWVSKYRDQVLEVPSFQIKGPEFELTGNSTFHLNDARNPHMDLRVKSPFMSIRTFKGLSPDPLLPGWMEHQLYPRLSAGQVRVDAFALKGTFHEIETLIISENPKVLTLGFTWRGLQVFQKNEGLPIRDVPGRLVLRDGALVVDNLQGRFGRSSIRQASLSIQTFAKEALDYDISIEGAFDLEDLRVQGQLDVIPGPVRAEVARFQSASGRLEAKTRFICDDDFVFSKLIEGQFRSNGAAFRHDALPLALTLKRATLDIPFKGPLKVKGRGTWGATAFQVSGEGTRQWKQARFDLSARMDLDQLYGIVTGGRTLPFRLNRALPGRLSLTKEHAVWTCKGRVPLLGVRVKTPHFMTREGGPEDRIRFHLDVDSGNIIHLRNLTGSIGDSRVSLSGSHDIREQQHVEFRVSTRKLRLEDLGIHFKTAKREARGIIKGQAEVRVPLKDPWNPSIKGTFEGRELFLLMEGIPAPIHDLKFDLAFLDREVELYLLKMAVGESRFQIQGHLKGWDGLRGDLRINADQIIFPASKKGPLFQDFSKKNESFQAFLKRSIIKMHLSLHRGQWKNLEIGPLQAECDLRGGDFYIKRSRIQTGHGVLNVKGHVKAGTRSEKLFSAFFNLKKQPLSPLLDMLALDPEQLEGRLTLEGVLYMKGRDKNELISSLTGSANLLIEEGKVGKPRILFQVLEFLSVQNIFKQRPPDISKEGLYFESIQGHLSVNEGVLETDRLLMKGPVLNAAATGTVDLSHDAVDADLAAAPLGTIDKVLSNIPVVGYVLTGREKALVIYNFKVQGPLFNPEVRYVPLKDLGNKMVGVFTRIFMAPGQLFKDIRAMAVELAAHGVPLPELETGPNGADGP